MEKLLFLIVLALTGCGFALVLGVPARAETAEVLPVPGIRGVGPSGPICPA
jgi:hypothetical protein